MNKTKFFGIFILFVLLITCTGIAFASSGIDNSYIDDSADDIDDLDADIDDDLDDEDWEDYDDEDNLDDEDWEDYDDEDDLDDEDWEDYDDEDDLDDEDWDDDGEYYANWTPLDGKMYKNIVYYAVASKAAGGSYPMEKDTSDSNSEYGASASGSSSNNRDTFAQDASQNSNPVQKTIDLNKLSEIALSESNTSQTNDDVENDENNSNVDLGNSLFSVLALLLICLLIFL